MEWIECAEGVAAAPAAQLDRAVAEAEEGLEVLPLAVEDRGEDLWFRFVLGEQPLLDHVAHIRAGQRKGGLEATHDLRQILRVRASEGPQDLVQCGLRRNEDPGSPVADCRQGLDDGLQVEHQLRVLSDELADLIDEEVEPEAGRLPVDVLPGHSRKILDRDAVVLADLPHYTQRLRLGHTEVLGIRPRECRLARRRQCLAVLLPFAAVHPQIGLLERRELAAHVEVVLEAGNVSLLPEIAATLVQHLHEHLEDRGRVVTADPVELLIDVEEDAFRRHAGALRQVGSHDLILDLGQQDVSGARSTRERRALEQQREHLQQMRLAGAEEPRDPDSIGGQLVQVAIGEGAQLRDDVAGEDVLLELHL